MHLITARCYLPEIERPQAGIHPMNPEDSRQWKSEVLDQIFVALAASKQHEDALVYKGARVLNIHHSEGNPVSRGGGNACVHRRFSGGGRDRTVHVPLTGVIGRLDVGTCLPIAIIHWKFENSGPNIR